MAYYTLPLEHKLATLDMVGGKGMSLSKLLTAGIPVPDGFHVTTASYQLFIQENDIQPKIDHLLTGINSNHSVQLELEEVSKQIALLFCDGKIPKEVSSAILTAYSVLGNLPVAVRSSATAEDLPDASFAGQQETYLNIQGANAVLNAVKRCWASLWTARALAYRMKNGINQKNVALAVVVQKLVYSDASGVLFTLNPVSGKRSELYINASWGLGEAVVSSLVTPDTIVVDADNKKIVSYETASKEAMTVRTANGTEEKTVPERLRKRNALTRNQAIRLAQLGKKIETVYGMPMDIEWALEKDTLYIVQARPITVLPPEWVVPEQGVIYTKGSLAEHLPNPVIPLFATLGLEQVNRASALLFQEMFGKSGKTLLPENGAYQTINGYVYFCCKFKPLLIAAKSLSPRSLCKTLTHALPRWETAYKDFENMITQWEEKNFHAMTACDLLEGVQGIFYAACVYFTRIQLTLPACSLSEMLLTKLFAGAARRAGVADSSVLLLGFDTIVLQSEKDLLGLVQWAKHDHALYDYLQKEPSANMAEDFISSTPPDGISQEIWCEWKSQIKRYFEEFGRTAYEFDFSCSTPEETLTPTFESVKAFTEGKAESPFSRQATAETGRKQAEAEMQSHIGGLRKKLFWKILPWAQENAPMREDAIYAMGLGHPLIRRMLREIAQRLVCGSAISKPDDLYWLTESELATLSTRLDENAPLSHMHSAVAARKAELEEYRQYTAPPQLPQRSKKNASQAALKRKDGKIVLTGIGTSGGVATAPACVLHSPADFESFRPGSVLVAATTTPAWTPLFSSASAVVTDIGGPLSHSSIVAPANMVFLRLWPHKLPHEASKTDKSLQWMAPQAR